MCIVLPQAQYIAVCSRQATRANSTGTAHRGGESSAESSAPFVADVVLTCVKRHPRYLFDAILQQTDFDDVDTQTRAQASFSLAVLQACTDALGAPPELDTTDGLDWFLRGTLVGRLAVKHAQVCHTSGDVSAVKLTKHIRKQLVLLAPEYTATEMRMRLTSMFSEGGDVQSWAQQLSVLKVPRLLLLIFTMMQHSNPMIALHFH